MVVRLGPSNPSLRFLPENICIINSYRKKKVPVNFTSEAEKSQANIKYETFIEKDLFAYNRADTSVV